MSENLENYEEEIYTVIDGKEYKIVEGVEYTVPAEEAAKMGVTETSEDTSEDIE
ncbi:MAG: hypothetical protein JXQ77_06090 [Campylobacterales bacterium]|nr:hypothetical protein [Campylobacterales bacterium]